MSSSILCPTFENLRYEKKNQIAFITIARPKVLNALNAPTLQELDRAFETVRDDDDVRVAILTGEGEKAFVAGRTSTNSASALVEAPKPLPSRGQAVFSLARKLRQAGHCGRQRLCSRRRLRTRAGLHVPHRLRKRPLWPA